MCVLCHCQPIPTAYVIWMLLLIQVGSTVSRLISGCQGQKWGRLLLPAAKKRIHVIITLFSPRVNLQFRDDVNMCLRVLCFLEKVGSFLCFFLRVKSTIWHQQNQGCSQYQRYYFWRREIHQEWWGLDSHIPDEYRQQWPNIESIIHILSYILESAHPLYSHEFIEDIFVAVGCCICFFCMQTSPKKGIVHNFTIEGS